MNTDGLRNSTHRVTLETIIGGHLLHHDVCGVYIQIISNEYNCLKLCVNISFGCGVTTYFFLDECI